MLAPAAILDRLRAAFPPEALPAAHLDGLHPSIDVSPLHWHAVALYLRDEPFLSFTLLRSVGGVDYPDKQQLVALFELMSFDHHHEICIKVHMPRANAEVASVADVWRAADWHERETYDLFGINFLNHPDSVTDDGIAHPRRILLPDDWIGHPLLKDYPFPREYHGIPGTVETDWAQKPNYPK